MQGKTRDNELCHIGQQYHTPGPGNALGVDSRMRASVARLVISVCERYGVGVTYLETRPYVS